MTKIFQTVDSQLPITGDLRLGGFFDQRIITLLKTVDETGSLNQAAKQVGLSYKGAWQMIERANNLAPKALITTTTGGSKGGGTRLTDAGQALVALFTDLDSQHRAFLQQLNDRLSCDSDVMLLLKRLTIKTSATNQLFGQISAIQHGAVNAEVTVQLKGGAQVTANVTDSSTDRLALQTGADAVLLINSGDIVLLASGENARISAANCLTGTVIRRVDDALNAQIWLQLGGAEILTVTLTQTSAQALALHNGVEVRALFKSNAVLLGVAA